MVKVTGHQQLEAGVDFKMRFIFTSCALRNSERTLMNYYSSKLHYLQFVMAKSGERSHNTQIY